MSQKEKKKLVSIKIDDTLMELLYMGLIFFHTNSMMKT